MTMKSTWNPPTLFSFRTIMLAIHNKKDEINLNESKHSLATLGLEFRFNGQEENYATSKHIFTTAYEKWFVLKLVPDSRAWEARAYTNKNIIGKGAIRLFFIFEIKRSWNAKWYNSPSFHRKSAKNVTQHPRRKIIHSYIMFRSMPVIGD